MPLMLTFSPLVLAWRDCNTWFVLLTTLVRLAEWSGFVPTLAWMMVWPGLAEVSSFLVGTEVMLGGICGGAMVAVT